MDEVNFDWMDFYQAFANRLLDFKDNREEIINKFKKIYADIGMSWNCLEKDLKGNFVNPKDIDPFTTMGFFNRKMKNENRFKIIEKAKEEFNISEQIPTGFPGIPRIMNNNPRFYAYEYEGRKNDDIDNLWNVFEAAINYSDNKDDFSRKEFIKWFDIVKDQKGIGLSYYTSGLFWIRPYTFINLDSRNLKFFADSNLFSDELVNEIKALKNNIPSGDLYLKICDECALVIENSDYEHLVDFSLNAYFNDVGKEVKSAQKENSKSQIKTSNNIKKDLNEPDNHIEERNYDSFHDYLKDKGYYFNKETIENYLLSLKVKPFVILTGNSGTGKTKLSQLFAQYLNQKDNYKIIPVGSNWTENRHILGFFNILENEAQYTPAYYLIEKANINPYPHFLILDEMNLSHVERYFADFLSAIESNENIPLHGEDELELPSNLFIVGTVNVDETTYMFSPKVLDRANTIEFETYSAKDYMTNKFDTSKPEGNIEYLEDILQDQDIQYMSIQELEQVFDNDEFWQELSDEIFKFQEILKESGFDFGFRVINEIVRFMAVAYKYENEPENWTNWKRYFDAQIKQKMLPKLHGSQKVIGETLDNLLEACEEYPTSKAKLEEMVNVLEKQRYVSFIN